MEFGYASALSLVLTLLLLLAVAFYVRRVARQALA
jgi:ABC-type sugar transport system permease subunit